MWQGFAYEPRQGDCSLFKAHLFDNVCSGNADHFEYLWKWMARAVQFPSEVGEVAVVLRGVRGIGKTFFAEHFGALFGAHYKVISDPEHLVGKFNAHLQQAVVVLADEALYAGNRKHEGVLKTIVTGKEIQFEAKYVQASQERNYIHLILASNNEWTVSAGEFERRFFALDVGANQLRQFAYFAAIKAQLASGGYEALLHELDSVDLSRFQVRDVPETQALHNLQALTRGQADVRLDETWVHELLADRLGDLTGKIRAEDIDRLLGPRFNPNVEKLVNWRRESMRSLGFEPTKLRFGGPSPERCWAGSRPEGEASRVAMDSCSPRGGFGV